MNVSEYFYVFFSSRRSLDQEELWRLNRIFWIGNSLH